MLQPLAGDKRINTVISQVLLLLLQLLRPPAYPASVLSSRQGRAWVLCLANLAHQLDTLAGTDQAVEQGPLWNAVGLRVLLEQVLPVLQHAAGPDHMTSHDHVPVSNEDMDSETDPPPTPDGYSTLLLLGAAAQLLHACIPAATTSQAAHLILSKGLQHAGGTQQGQPAGSTAFADNGGDDLETASHAAQTLAAELVSGGAWWQEAKAHYPLLLIDALHAFIQVCCVWDTSFNIAFCTTAALYSYPRQTPGTAILMHQH
jgi:hypothetical protein